MLGTKSDAKTIADAIYDLAAAIREHTRAMNEDFDEEPKTQRYLDGTPVIEL